MFVLGIDPGLTRTGYGIVEAAGTTARAISVGVIRTAANTPMASRLMEIYEDVSSLIDEHHVDGAAIEEVFTNRNRATATGVARASGVIMLALAQAGITVVEYTPSAVKMALTGFGAAEKQQVQNVVQMRLGLATSPQPADAADALAIALCHMQASRIDRRLQAGTPS